MFSDSIEPTEILYNAYLIIMIFFIDTPTEIAMLFHCGTLNHVYFPWLFSFIRMLICISEIKTIFGIGNGAVPLISGFSIPVMNNFGSCAQKSLLFTKLPSFGGFIWGHVAADVMSLNSMNCSEISSLSIAFKNCIM